MLTYNVSGMSVIDVDPHRSWRKVSEPGELYPRLQLRAVEVADGPLAGKFVVIDETGWNGYETTVDEIATKFGFTQTMADAMSRIDQAIAAQQ